MANATDIRPEMPRGRHSKPEIIDAGKAQEIAALSWTVKNRNMVQDAMYKVHKAANAGSKHCEMELSELGKCQTMKSELEKLNYDVSFKEVDVMGGWFFKSKVGTKFVLTIKW